VTEIKFKQFFDRATVIQHVKDGTKSVLSKAGAFIWRRAKSSIRKRKKIADAGSPPSGHTNRLRDLIFFAFDEASRSVVVGPLFFKKKNGGKTVPLLLEEGGVGVNSRGKPATYRKFPFMQPALEKEQHNFPELFANSIK